MKIQTLTNQSSSYKRKLTQSLVTLSLMSIAMAANGQVTSLKKLPIEDFWSVEKIKQAPEISSEVFNNIEKFLPEERNASFGKIRRIAIQSEMEYQGKAVNLGKETRIFERIVEWPGYYAVSSPEASDSSRLLLREISFLNFSTIASRLKITTNLRLLFTSNSTTDITKFISESRLPEKFESALKPGGTWTYERVTESETTTISGKEEKKRGDISFKTEICKNGEEAAASSLHEKFNGNMISIHCRSKNELIDENADYIYLKDYGFFIPTKREAPARKAGSGAVTYKFTILDVEVDS